MSFWTEERKAEVLDRWGRGETPTQIRHAMNLTRGQMAGRITRWNLHSPSERRRYVDPENWATIAGVSRFQGMVTDEGDILKPGTYQQKLGGRVTKGAWKGFPIYAITLEERKTCPTTCAMWTSCYGNNLRWAKRMKHGPAFERNLWGELGQMQRRHPRGFVVRAHILGDFYSLGIVELWREALTAFPALHVFGYTARQDRIGRAVAALRDAQWDRFAVRTSGAADGPRTLVVENVEDVPAGAILCPAQTGKTRSCSSCGLCWAAAAKDRPVAFLRH